MCRAPTPISKRTCDQRADRPHAPCGDAGAAGARDVMIVASVSCIYGIGSVETYPSMGSVWPTGRRSTSSELLARWSNCNTPQRHRLRARRFPRARRHDRNLSRRIWRTAPGGSACSATRSKRSSKSIPLTGEKDLRARREIKLYANSHYVTPQTDPARRRSRDQGGTDAAARWFVAKANCWKRNGCRNARRSIWK